MCGIIGAINTEKQNVNQWMQDQYQDQRERGTEGFGLIFIKNDGTYEVKRATHETQAIIDLNLNKSKIILMHHRNPTSSDNKMNQTHPILVNDSSLEYKYLILHNGVISNDNKLKKRHEELGFVYNTRYDCEVNYEKFNDSEALAIEIALFIEKEIKTPIIEGSAAFIGLQINKKTNKVEEIFFGRNDRNPINMSKTRGRLRLSSEGEGTEVKSDMLYSCNLKDLKLSSRKMIFAKEEKKEIKTYETDKYRDHGSNNYWDYYKTPKSNLNNSNNDKEDIDTPPETATVEEIEEEEEEKDTLSEDIEDIIIDGGNEITELIEAFGKGLDLKETVFVTEPKNYVKRIITIMYEMRKKSQDLHANKLMNESKALATRNIQEYNDRKKEEEKKEEEKKEEEKNKT